MCELLGGKLYKALFNVFLASFFLTTRVSAEVPSELQVSGHERGCPHPAAVAQQLATLFPETRFEVATAGTVRADEAHVRIDDRGATFNIRIADQRKRFIDTRRNCEERARNAAVFVALVLDPLRVPHVKPPEPLPPPIDTTPEPEPAPFPTPETTEPRLLDLSIGPVAQMAPSAPSLNTPFTGGVSVRLHYGDYLGIVIGAAALLPSTLHYPSADASALWIPLDLGAFASLRSDPLQLRAELSAVGALLSVRGESVEQPATQFRVGAGARFGVELRYWASASTGLFIAGFGTAFPRPFSLQVAGLGAVGETPRYWLGASLGAVLEL